MTEDERDALIDLLPDGMTLWAHDDELPHFADRTLARWLDDLGHPRAVGHGFCRTCGPAITCLSVSTSVGTRVPSSFGTNGRPEGARGEAVRAPVPGSSGPTQRRLDRPGRVGPSSIAAARAVGEAAGPGGAPRAERGRTTWRSGERRPQSAARKARDGATTATRDAWSQIHFVQPVEPTRLGAVSVDALCEGMTGHAVHWADDPDPETWQQCPASEFDGYGLQCQKEAGHNLCTFEQESAQPDSEETTDA